MSFAEIERAGRAGTGAGDAGLGWTCPLTVPPAVCQAGGHSHLELGGGCHPGGGKQRLFPEPGAVTPSSLSCSESQE